MTAFTHVQRVTGAVHDGLHAWVRALMADAGVPCDVAGAVPTDGGPTLALMPYQMVLESQHTVPSVPYVPHPPDSKRDAIPAAWRTIGVAMTDVLLESFPARAKGRPGLGPLDPAPLLGSLPDPIAAWYRTHREDWLVGGTPERGRLPAVAWRQPFAFAVRYVAVVVDPDTTPGGDATRLQALAVLAAGIRLSRFFRVRMPPVPASESLLELVRAFSEVDTEAAAPIADALAAATSERELAVGLTPHNELTDADLALVCMSLKQPMQPAIVFSLRLSLGEGPELGAGALPHLASVEGERP